MPKKKQILELPSDTEKEKGYFASFYLNPKYSDLTIICGTKTFPGHRIIVCSQSKYFSHACDGNFKEALSREIVLKDHEPILVEPTLQYLYTGNYTVSPPFDGPAAFDDPAVATETHQSTEEFLKRHISCFHALMYLQGEYFQIDGLKVLAKGYFRASFLGRCDMDSFPAAVEEVYRSTAKHDRGLKDLVIELMMAKLRTFQDEQKQAVKKLLEDIPEFSHDLCVALMDRHECRCVEPYSMY
ncbi:BTB/POZ domain-containing protein [Coccidioides immitis RS]|uniref:BTB/POZ domain-containing protein n=1 Tax=Coccidioides immitis (strain RS) TaxID=246410 RepID=J3KLZ5_COCIM|nr:BTB/POZ domain-containing protein [Coccidioides immitis RS]EAS37374.3 BTB/POZ domain-containing protein [Coccidioides immitis RS]